MPKLLLSNAQKGWPLFQRLLVALFKFMEPYLRNADLSDPVSPIFEILIVQNELRLLFVLFDPSILALSHILVVMVTFYCSNIQWVQTWQVRLLYKGTLRVLLVLLHDFPEFLCDHHFSFCDVIPPSCIQMRNLILSAFPRNMRLPDPFTPNLKVVVL